MKHFIQFDRDGKFVDAFFLSDKSDKGEFLSKFESPLHDFEGTFSKLEIGKSVAFSGTTKIKRIA